MEALDFSELVSVTDEELEHYHNKAEEHPALLPLDAATEYNTLKEQHPDALVGFEQGGQFEFYGEDARKVCELVGGKLLEKETECPVREKRDEIIILRTTKAEKNRIYEKMLGMGIRSLSAYIRKMALDGYCLNLDLPQLRRMSYLLQMCSNNLNQYAKRANESGKIYATDMEDLRQRLDELIDIGRQILSKLAEL